MSLAPLKTLQNWLDLEPGELKPAGLCFVIAFTWGFSQMLSWTAANTLFLKYFDAAQLPIISIASAVLIPLSGLLFLHLNRRLKYSTQFLIFASLFVAAPMFFWFLLQGQGPRWASLGFSIWYYMEVAFSTLLMDSFINRMFNLRQTKRVFGPISTGADLAGIPAGFLLGIVVRQSGVENLLLFAAAVSSIVLVLFLYAAHVYRHRMRSVVDSETEDADDEGTTTVPLRSLFRHPLILCIIVLGALNEFNLEFINNAFYSQTEQYLSQPEEMAAFLGKFFALASILSSVIQFLASSRLMKMIGVGGCLVLGPALVGLMLLTFVAGSLFGAAPALVFGAMAAAKFMQFTVMVNVNDVVQFTLVRSLSPELQDRVLALSGTVLSPLLGGLSGLVLLGMIHLFDAGAMGISMVVLCLLVVVVLVALRAAREYRRNLDRILSEHAISGIELPLDDPATVKTLLALIRSPDPQTALCSLEMLSRHSHARLKPALADALRHADVQVRRRAAVLYQSVCRLDDHALLVQFLESEPDPEAAAELLLAIGKAGGSDGAEILRRYLQRDEPVVVQGACVGLIRHFDSEAARPAVELLSGMAGSPDAVRRAAAAVTIGRIGPSPVDPLISPLLADPELRVREKAIAATGCLHRPELAAALLENLDNAELRPAVIKALIQGADTMLPSIDSLFDKPGQPPAMKQMILRIYGRVRSEKSADLLRRRLGDPDRALQSEAVTALARCRYRPTEGDAEILERLVQQFAACATWLLACKRELGQQQKSELLERALEHELRKAKQLIFELVGFIYGGESIRRIRSAYFQSDSEDRIAAAVELLDNILNSRHRSFLLPILEETSLDRRLATLEKKFPIDEGGMVMRLVEIMNGRYSAPNPWLQAVTLDYVAHSKSLSGVAEICRDEDITETTRLWLKPSEPVPGSEFKGLSVIDKVAALKRAAIFADVPDETLAEYAPATAERFFPKGVCIIRKGEAGSTLCLIVNGRVRIHTGERTIAELGEGDVFGELSALSPEPRSANVDAIADTRLLVMRAETIETMISERTEAAQGILRVLSRRIQSTIREKNYEDTGSFSVMRDSIDPKTAGGSRSDLSEVEKTVLLKSVPMFKSLPDEVLMHLASLAREQRFEAGGTLFRQGDFGTSMFVVADGELAVHVADKMIATVGRGKFIGELGLLTSEVRSTSVTTLRPTRLLKITQAAMAELMWDYPRVTRSLIQVLVTRLHTLISRGIVEAPPELRQGPATA